MGPSSRVQKRNSLQALTTSKSVKKSCMIMDAFLHIHNLKIQLEALKNLINHTHIPNKKKKKEVKVEKLGKGFIVKVGCEKEENKQLVSIMEVFDEMGLDVVKARVSCNYFFSMEAIVVPQHEALNITLVTQAILKAIE